MDMKAQLSDCQIYRYALWRRWGEGPQVVFVMFNPSTASATKDDPTIRRCIGFARVWGFGSLAVGNLFAFRTSSTAELRRCPEPIGVDNETWLLRLYAESHLAVAAWGNHGQWWQQGAKVRQLLPNLCCLGVTKRGEPKHPLYVSARTDYVAFLVMAQGR